MKYACEGEKGRRVFVLALERGERVMETLKAFAREREVEGGWISGLGAVEQAELGWFDREGKTYVTRAFPDVLELLSLQGNVGRHESEVVVHAHALCAGRDLQAAGGHLVEARCAVTVELRVEETPFPLLRAPVPAFGLNLLDLPEPR